MPSAPTFSLTGQSLGKFQVGRRLGVGGVGEVYEAEDTLLARTVAIKVLNPQVATDGDTVRRFIREARAAARLNHPNVVALYEIDQIDGTYYIAMELAAGGSAQDALKREVRIPCEQATRWMADACRGLMAAHDQGAVHRDIKPANLLLDAAGVVKLADFGLVKPIGQTPVSTTAAGNVLGTPAFMSPEQCRGETVDFRSDVYSLGATYHALLTGSPPYEAPNDFGVMYAHCACPVPDPRGLVADLPEACAAIVAKAMAKNPSDRYANALELLAALSRAIGEEAPDASFRADATTKRNPVTTSLPRVADTSGSALRQSRASGSGRRIAAFAAVFALVLSAIWWNNLDGDGPATVPAKPTSAANPSQASIAPTSPSQAASPAAAPNASPSGSAANAAPVAFSAADVPDWARKPLMPILLPNRVLGDFDGYAADLHVSSDGSLVAAASAKNVAYVWSFPDGKLLHKFEGHRKSADIPFGVMAIVVHGPTHVAVTAGGDRQLILWNLQSGKPVHKITMPRESATLFRLTLSADGKRLMASGAWGFSLYDIVDGKRLEEGSEVARMTLAQRFPTSMAFLPGEDRIASVSSSGVVMLLDVPRQRAEVVWRLLNGGLACVGVLPGGDDLVIGDARTALDDNNSPIQTPHGGKVIRLPLASRKAEVLTMGVGTPMWIDVSRRRPLIAAGGAQANKKVRLIDIARQTTYELTTEVHGWVTAGRFSPDGMRLVVAGSRAAPGSNRNGLHVFDLPAEIAK